MRWSEVEAGVIGEICEVVHFFFVEEACVARDRVGLHAGKGEEGCPAEAAWFDGCEEAERVHDLIFPFMRDADHDKGGCF